MKEICSSPFDSLCALTDRQYLDRLQQTENQSTIRRARWFPYGSGTQWPP